jgi:O-antigen/teichoic acid export membrane protein
MKFRQVALRGGLITGVAQGIKIGVQFLSVVVLARLLAPADFGLVAAVWPVIAFVSLFQNLGLQQAVIQRKEISERELNQIFWITALVALGCTAAVAGLAPAVAAFYGDARMTGVMLAASLPIFLSSLAAVPLSLMNRNLQFGQLALNDVGAAVAGFVASVAAAYLGMAYWSLLFGTAVSAAVGSWAAWRAVRWKPGRPDLRTNSDIIAFGAGFTGFNLVNFFARNLDNILIGKFSGTVELGYYDRAYKLLLFPIQNINQPLTRIMIPLLSRVQDDKARFRDIYLRVNWVMAAVIIPGMGALTFTSEHVVDILFGAKWRAVAPIFAWLGLVALIQPTMNTTGWIFLCQGKTTTLFRWGVYASVTTVASFVAGLHWGSVGVAAAYAISGYALRVPVMAVILDRIGPVSAVDFLTLQGTFIVSCLLTWLGYRTFLVPLTARSDVLAVSSALVLSYATALALISIISPSRKAIWTTLRAISQATSALGGEQELQAN